MPNDKIKNLATREESLILKLILSHQHLLDKSIASGLTPMHFQNDITHEIFEFAFDHHARYGTLLTRPALDAALAGRLKPEEAAMLRSKYDAITAEFGVRESDFNPLLDSVMARLAQRQAYAVCMEFTGSLLESTRGQDEIVERFRRAVESVQVGRTCKTTTPALAPKPWQLITAEDVAADIRGSRLETLVRVLASVATPPLPLELTLPKALALAGAAMSRPQNGDWMQSFGEGDEADGWGAGVKLGADHLKFKINTSGGQACNVWALVVASSGIGKDIGNVPERLAMGAGWLIGSSGSAEGLKDALAQKGSGLLAISELSHFLDRNRWQYSCTDFLTSAFNKGWFEEKLSRASKNGGHVRRASFCFPSMLANIQPEVLESQGVGTLLHSGFIQRFLISTVGRGRIWRPVTTEIDVMPAFSALQEYELLEGVASVPDGYLGDVLTSFAENEATMESHYARLVNEYAPRIACMLSATPLNPTGEDFAKAGRMIMWFYAMAEKVVSRIDEDDAARETNKMVARILAFVREQKKVPWREFTQRFARVPGWRRKQVLRQMEEDGQIRIVTAGRGDFICLAE